MKKILIVDDEEMVRNFVVSVLKRAGYEIITAVDGCEGLEKIEKEKPDLVISDHDMPRMDGLTMMYEILSKHPQTKILLMSGGAEGFALTLELEELLGPGHFIFKPFEPLELKKMVANILGH